MKRVIGIFLFGCFLPGAALSSDRGFSAGTAELAASVESYLRVSTQTEAAVFQVISAESGKGAARREVLRAAFAKYLVDEHRDLSALRKDVVAAFKLSEGSQEDPAPALGELERIGNFARSKTAVKKRKLEAMDEALKVPERRFEDLARLSRLFYPAVPSAEAAADAYAEVQASRGFLLNFIVELRRSAPLFDLGVASMALGTPQARPAKQDPGRQSSDGKAFADEEVANAVEVWGKAGGEVP